MQQNGAWTDRFRLAKQTYDHGLFTHAPSRLQVELPEPAVEFVADYGARFLPLYAFEVETGAWTLREDRAPDVALSIADVLAGAAPLGVGVASEADRRRLLAETLAQAERIALDLPEPTRSGRLADDLADLQFFALPA